MTDAKNAAVVIKHLEKIFGMIDEHKNPFIARIRKDDVAFYLGVTCALT